MLHNHYPVSVGLVLFGVFYGLVPHSSGEENFPLLLSPAALAAQHDAVCLVDVRSAEAFLEKRIPGSVWLSSREFSETRNGIPGMLPAPEVLSALLSERGIGQDEPVVLYGENDSAGDLSAVARVFWALDSLGYPQVAILDGGLSRWEAENRELTTEPPSSPRPHVTVALNPEMWRKVADKTRVAQALKNQNVVLVDARPANQYSGATPILNMTRKGHIPGARNIPYTTVLTAPHAVFKPLPEIEGVLYTDGVTRETEVITYCNTGMFSSTVYLAYRLLGHESVAMYDGGMFEWDSDGSLPVSIAPTESN
ncbi:MAG TPA: sulfurtransferase [Candidatus Hydrogenedentes bacterium]|nr:sulfurtransferase [Candidatus Hydrogenedentota bacterium]